MANDRNEQNPRNINDDNLDRNENKNTGLDRSAQKGRDSNPANDSLNNDDDLDTGVSKDRSSNKGSGNTSL